MGTMIEPIKFASVVMMDGIESKADLKELEKEVSALLSVIAKTRPFDPGVALIIRGEYEVR